MGYIDKMIEAHEKEWHAFLCGKKPGIGIKEARRIAMEAAFEAAYFHKQPTKAPSCIDPDCLNGKNTLINTTELYKSITATNPMMERFKRIEKAAGVTYEEAFGKPKIDWLALNRSCSE